MNKEDIQELMDYNLEYMELQQSEEIFGENYTSAVDLKYANKQIEKLEKENKELKDRYEKCKKQKIKVEDACSNYKYIINKAIEYIENHKLDFKQGTTTFGSERLSMEERKLIDILSDEDNE